MGLAFDKFSITAIPRIIDAYCECGELMREVSNGFISRAMFCVKCENVYRLTLVKVPRKKVSKEYLAQAREDASR